MEKERPVLSVDEMAKFLAKYPKPYQLENLELFKRIHEPSYADNVEKALKKLTWNWALT